MKDVYQQAVDAYYEWDKNKTHAAKALGWTRSTFRYRIDKALGKCSHLESERRDLYWDIETSGMKFMLFSCGQQYVAPENILQYKFLISVHWSWSDEDEVHNVSILDNPDFDKDFTDDKIVVEKIKELLEEADVAIAHNGDNFDIKEHLSRLIYHGIPPVREPRYIDTLKDARKARFPSNKLDELCKYLGLGRKKPTKREWWIKATDHGCRESIQNIVDYGDGDIPTLKALCMRLKPYVSRFHPNYNVYSQLGDVCRSCGSMHLQLLDKTKKIGQVSEVEEYRCKACGSLTRGGKNLRKGGGFR